ncbi:MAG: hypothetical protein ACTSW1_07725 [Candidatus Hodarchaeales archaeon]
MKTPCHECICVPICRHRLFGEVVEECSLLRKYLYYQWKTKGCQIQRADHWRRAKAVANQLESTKWTITEEGLSGEWAL